MIFSVTFISGSKTKTSLRCTTTANCATYEYNSPDAVFLHFKLLQTKHSTAAGASNILQCSKVFHTHTHTHTHMYLYMCLFPANPMFSPFFFSLDFSISFCCHDSSYAAIFITLCLLCAVIKNEIEFEINRYTHTHIYTHTQLVYVCTQLHNTHTYVRTKRKRTISAIE